MCDFGFSCVLFACVGFPTSSYAFFGAHHYLRRSEVNALIAIVRGAARQAMQYTRLFLSCEFNFYIFIFRQWRRRELSPRKTRIFCCLRLQSVCACNSLVDYVCEWVRVYVHSIMCASIYKWYLGTSYTYIHIAKCKHNQLTFSQNYNENTYGSNCAAFRNRKLTQYTSWWWNISSFRLELKQAIFFSWKKLLFARLLLAFHEA